MTNKISKLNQELHVNNISARFKIYQKDNGIFVQVIDLKSNRTMEEISIAEISKQSDNLIDKEG
ncbi:flagellar protein FlaG [Liquorilactobacillus sicerae]|uniref:flagellar protein FlaG n=1 Tax=Liquorilactobacillus sicerae TaxID=1416943 RepID=UPI002481343C|nr:flagellar protein FlaG [Liquorilactobacillus sicerae]